MRVSDDPELKAIAEQALRLTEGRCALRVHGEGPEAILVIELPSDAQESGRSLHPALKAWCADARLPVRHVIVRTSTPRFIAEPPSGSALVDPPRLQLDLEG